MKIRSIIVVIAIALFNIFSIPASYSAEKNYDFTVIIDPGHGGNDAGAIDNGVKEKDINLAVAKRLQEDLNKKIKGIRVVLTRNNDTFVSLQGRAEIANKNKADLFISIHTNSVDAKNPNRKGVAGTSVYALGLHKDKDNLNVAKRENSVIELETNHNEKYSGFDPSKDESYIIFEMAQKKNLEQSLRFANYAQKQLVSVADRRDRGVKQAGFWVLWATSMPAVLVELDFICNPTSASFMASSEGEKKMAAALCNAVEQYYNSVKNSLASGKRVALTSKRSQSETKSSSVDTRTSSVSSSGNTNRKIDNRDGEKTEKGTTNNTLGSLATVGKSQRTDTPPVTSASSKRATTARRRRSASSKVASEKRDVAIASIPVKSEKDYLAKNIDEKEPQTVVKDVSEKKETPKERKKRLAKEKKQKEKERKEAKKRMNDKRGLSNNSGKLAQNNSSSNNKSTKKFVVSSNGSVSNVSSTSSSSSTSASVQVKKRKSLNSKTKN